MVMEIFVMESGLLRTLKIIEKDGEEMTRYQTIDAISLRREIAGRIIDLEAYPFQFPKHSCNIKTGFATLE